MDALKNVDELVDAVHCCVATFVSLRSAISTTRTCMMYLLLQHFDAEKTPSLVCSIYA